MKNSRTKFYLSAAAVLVTVACILCFSSCANSDDIEDPIESASFENELPTMQTQDTSQLIQYPGYPNQYPGGIYYDPSYMNPGYQTQTTQPVENETEEEEDVSGGLVFVSNGNGTCTLTGPGNCTDTCIVIPEKSPAGDIVTTVAERAFYGCTFINAIQIPSTVLNIGNMAFANCTSLVYISVSQDNQSYKDAGGVLYSKDGSSLILYPSAKGGSSVTISNSVTKIADMAFYKCDALRVISYDGTQAEWARINIGQNNYGLYTASVSFTDSGK